MEANTTYRSKNYIRPAWLIVSLIAYTDLLFTPNKGFHFLPFFPKFQMVVVTGLLLSLIVLIFNELKNSISTIKWQKITRLIFFFCATLLFNEILFDFHFYPFNLILELSVTILFSIPILMVVSDWMSGVDKKYIYLLIGLMLAIPTWCYFTFKYESYESYWNGYPIVFVHLWIRNWIVYIGIVLTLTSAYNILRQQRL